MKFLTSLNQIIKQYLNNEIQLVQHSPNIPPTFRQSTVHQNIHQLYFSLTILVLNDKFIILILKNKRAKYIVMKNVLQPKHRTQFFFFLKYVFFIFLLLLFYHIHVVVVGLCFCFSRSIWF